MISVLVAAAVGLAVTLLGTPVAIKAFTLWGWGQRIREDGPHTHLEKMGTPTMGGIVMLVALVVGRRPVGVADHADGCLADTKRHPEERMHRRMAGRLAHAMLVGHRIHRPDGAVLEDHARKHVGAKRYQVRLLIKLGERVADCLLEHRAPADALNHQRRRRLALAKTGHPHVAGETAGGAAQRAVDVVCGDLDLDLGPRVGQLCDRRLHRA